jgi:accessory gene regulator protein AgrB
MLRIMNSENMKIVVATYLVRIILFFLLTFLILFLVSKLTGKKDE